MATTRVPLNTFAIPFGFAGLAEVWTAAGRIFGWPDAIADAFWLLTGLAWAALIVVHLVHGARSGQRLVEQLRHPAQGPIAALVPVVGMLLGARLHDYLPIAGAVLVLASILVAAVLAAWLIGGWLRGGVATTAVHGGYLLPTVAAGLIGGYAAAEIRMPALGWAAFAVGILFWIVIFTVLMVRLAVLSALPGPLVPTMAILVAPPAVAGLTWSELTGSRTGPVIDALAGLTVLLVLVQVALIPVYRRTPFSLGAWSFTFAFAAVATFFIQTVSGIPNLAPIVAAALAAAITLLVAVIAVLSLRLATRSRSQGEAEGEPQLLVADVERAA